MRLFYALFHSFSGLRQAFQKEAAFRLEVYGLLFAGFFLYVCDYPLLERLFMGFTYMIVIIVELLNTGLEKAIDRFSQEQHPLSKMVKDVGSAAVFLSILICMVVWMSIILSHGMEIT
jgi:diacylglycerol kinase (ATP)